jgi:HSP20 family molecular chaperone IbpA
MNYNANTLIDRLLYANNRSFFRDINQSQKNTINTNYMNISDDGILNMEFDVPGFSKNTITIKSVGNRLFINGETDDRTLNKEYKLEQKWNADATTAKVLDGVLTISIPPLEESDKRVKTISVK